MIIRHRSGLRNTFSIILIMLITLPAISQEQQTCAEKLQTAQALFERGQVEQVAPLITPCLQSGFNREELLQAYKLILQTYLYNNKAEAADSAMLTFLKRYPEYRVSPADHSSFVSHFNNYESKVIIQLSGKIGINLPYVFLKSEKSLFSPSGQQESSSRLTNFFGGIEAKYKLTYRIELNAGVAYSQFSFKRNETIVFAETEIIETQRRIEIPLSLTYDIFHFGRMTPYARLGVGQTISFSSSGQGSLRPSDDGNFYDRQGENMDLKRRFTEPFLQAGGGVKFKINKGYIFGEVSSNIGMLKQSTFGGYTGSDDDYHWYYMLPENNLRVNTLIFNAGYTYIFYKPGRRTQP